SGRAGTDDDDAEFSFGGDPSQAPTRLAAVIGQCEFVLEQRQVVVVEGPGEELEYGLQPLVRVGGFGYRVESGQDVGYEVDCVVAEFGFDSAGRFGLEDV